MTSVLRKSDSKIYPLIASTETQYQILVPCNPNHTFHIAEWIPREAAILLHISRPSNSAFCIAEGAPEIDDEMLGQLHLE
jgi:hypothetical protein